MVALIMLALLLLSSAGIGTQGFKSGQQGCPAGVPVLTVQGSTQGGAAASRAAAFRKNATLHVHRPYVFAQGVQAWDFDLAGNGTWQQAAGGGRIWRLCIQAEGAQSLTFLFSTVQLPLSGDLLVYAPGAGPRRSGAAGCATGCQRLTVHSVRHGRAVMTAPIPGSVVVLEHHELPNPRPRWRTLSLLVQSLLVGVRPLPLRLPPAAPNGLLAKSGALNRTVGGGQQAADWGDGSSNTSSNLAAAGATSSYAVNVDSVDVKQYLGSALNQAVGNSLKCQIDVTCDSEWATEANAVVLLIGIDDTSGFYCTGTLINAPQNEQYLLTANHCLGAKSRVDAQIFWGAVFDYEAACGKNDTELPPQYAMLQGLAVVWANEITDVMLLRLDDAIPPAYSPYFLGWDASGWLQPKAGAVSIHHPAGDRKKLARTTFEFRQGTYISDQPSHYVASWDSGAMEEGSSGSLLISADTRLALGPLTGGSENTRCQGGSDFYGSLYMAWKLGLSRYLGDGSRDSPAKMGPRQAILDGPGLIVNPDLLVIEEGPSTARLQISLSQAPAADEQLVVRASISGGGQASSITMGPTELVFDTANWANFQSVVVLPGEDAVQDGIELFAIQLQLSSSKDAGFIKQRSIPGVRLDNETPEGSDPRRPIAIPRLPYMGNVSLAASAGVAAAPLELSNTTLSEYANRAAPGAVAYVALNTAYELDMMIEACGAGALPPLVVVFAPTGVAMWSSAEPCSASRSDLCKSFQGTELRGTGSRCSGFASLLLEGTDMMGPYMLAVSSQSGVAGRLQLYVEGSNDLR